MGPKDMLLISYCSSDSLQPNTLFFFFLLPQSVNRTIYFMDQNNRPPIIICPDNVRKLHPFAHLPASVE